MKAARVKTRKTGSSVDATALTAVVRLLAQHAAREWLTTQRPIADQSSQPKDKQS
jgi:predicted RNA-binding Zn ribbon-like protein